MDSNRKWTLVVSIGLGIGSLVFAGRSLVRVVGRWRFSRKSNSLRQILKARLETPMPSTTVITRNAEWDEIYLELSRYHIVLLIWNLSPLSIIFTKSYFDCRDCSAIPILGFDCEWSNFNNKAQPVALIQLASYQGRCALVRVGLMSSIPETLKVTKNPQLFAAVSIVLLYNIEHFSWSQHN